MTIQAPKTSHSPALLAQVIEEMDMYSQAAFNKIQAIARLALMALEHPDSYRHPANISSTVVWALQAMRDEAGTAQNDINVAAEGVGGNYTDPSQQRRARAANQARLDARSKVQSNQKTGRAR